MCELCTGKAVIRHAGEGEAIWFDGGLLTITVAAGDTGGVFAAFEYVAERGKASPLHRIPTPTRRSGFSKAHQSAHRRCRTRRNRRRHLRVSPRRSPCLRGHLRDARILMMLTPGGGENFFRQAGAPAERRDLPPPSERNLEQFQAAAAATAWSCSVLRRSTWWAFTPADADPCRGEPPLTAGRRRRWVACRPIRVRRCPRAIRGRRGARPRDESSGGGSGTRCPRSGWQARRRSTRRGGCPT